MITSFTILLIIDRKNQKNNPQKLTIDEKIITPSENVMSLGLEIDSKLNFDGHISKLCNKSAGQLNALFRIEHLIRLEEIKDVNKQLYLCKF